MRTKLNFSRAQLDTTTVAQTSESAVSRVSKPAPRTQRQALPTWKSAIRQVGKPALPCVHLMTAGVVVAVLVVATAAHAQTTFTKITNSPVVSDAASSIAATWVDFDSDGDLDLYVSNSRGPNLLYRNDGLGAFTRITNAIVNASPGSLSPSYTSAAWADYDNDGRIDLFIARLFEPGLLFHQEADGTFARTTFGASPAGGPAWADYDNDGWLDLLVPYNSLPALWHNDGRGNLVAASTISISASGASVTWADLDNDGDMDALVAEGGSYGGSSVSTRFYRNDGRGVFTAITSGQVPQRARLVTNIAWGDYDNDGFLDLFLSRGGQGQSLPAFLFHNNRDSTFTQVEAAPFTTDTGFTLGSSWGDYDNDGWLDLFVAETTGAPNRLYHNNGDGTFSRVTSGSIATDPGLASEGAVWGDYDRDGFLDLFVANGLYSSPQPNDYLYHNDGNSNAWLTIKCVGTRSNRSAIGAKVRVKATINGRSYWQLREINTGDGWSGNPLEAHFGLGHATNVETLRIEWPSGTVQEFQNVAAKQLLTIIEPPRLQITPPQTGSPLKLTLRGGIGFTYALEASDDLLSWTPVRTNTATAFTLEVEDADAVNFPRRFYRARRQP
ncbi:MAG: CRTAC1 family protein [Verrucomicrobia bacterium]|nr:CRTAC1 family protein [Verrucomicrobiota bacterium]